MKTKPSLLTATLLALSATAIAGFIPLWYDAPKRNNPNDPFTKRPTFTNIPPVIPTPTPACVGGLDTTLYNFEAGIQGWGSTTAGGYTLISGLSSVASPSCNGSKALCGSLTFAHGAPTPTAQKANFSQSVSANYSGRKLSAAAYFPPSMSNGATQIKMYIKSAGLPGGYVYSNGPSVTIPVTGGWVGCVFDLSLTPVYQEPGKTTNTAAVQEIGLEIYSPPGEPNGTFNVCIDSWDPGPNPTPTVSPTVTMTYTPGAPTATPTNCVPVSLWNFDGGTVQGWAYDTAVDTGFTAIAPSSAQSKECTSSLACTASFANGATAGGVVLINGAGNGFPRNLTNKTISAWVYVPAGMSPASPPSGAFIYVKDGSFTWRQGAWTNLPSGGGWTPVSFNLTGQAWANVINEIGVKVGLGGCPSCTSWSGTVYIDSVDIQ